MQLYYTDNVCFIADRDFSIKDMYLICRLGYTVEGDIYLGCFSFGFEDVLLGDSTYKTVLTPTAVKSSLRIDIGRRLKELLAELLNSKNDSGQAHQAKELDEMMSILSEKFECKQMVSVHQTIC